ncbi:MAG: hypothetical protein ACTSO2_13725 [Promethearchaeota archaeon]
MIVAQQVSEGNIEAKISLSLPKEILRNIAIRKSGVFIGLEESIIMEKHPIIFFKELNELIDLLNEKNHFKKTKIGKNYRFYRLARQIIDNLIKISDILYIIGILEKIEVRTKRQHQYKQRIENISNRIYRKIKFYDIYDKIKEDKTWIKKNL